MKALIAATFLSWIIAVPAACAEESTEAPRTVTVSGMGEASAKPDQASIHVGVTSQGKTAQDALSANNRDMAALLTTLKDAGIADKDIQTSNFSVSPRYSSNTSRETGEREIIGYNVFNQARVKVRDLDNLGGILDASVRSGANQLHGVSFSISEPQSLLDDARVKAVDDAKRKAELLANAAGAQLGKALAIQEQGARTPTPYMARSMAMDMAESVPIAAGENTLSTSVTITFELK